jgi:colanic acid biosynthesis glycosyl transferase WcaI
MAERGINTRVLTGRPHYPEGAVYPQARGRCAERRVINGVDVARLPIPRRLGSAALRRMQTETQFLVRGVAALVRGNVRRAPLVISLCPSVLSVVLASLCTRRNGRHVAIVHDIQSGLARGLGMTSRGLSGVITCLERLAFNRADLVVVLSDDMRRELLSIGVKTPIEVFPIWTDTDSIQPTPVRDGRATTLLYSGNFGRKQGLSQLLDLAQVLLERGSDLRLVLRGAGSQALPLATEAATRRLDNIEFQPLVARERLSEGLAEGDIHLVPQHPAAVDFALPSKIFAIMAAARPFVAIAPERSALWRLQGESGAFVCVAPDDKNSLADAVAALADDAALRAELGARGRAYVLQHFSKQKSLDRLISALHGAA